MRLLGTKLAANSSHRGFGDQLYDLAGERPSLDLNFANTKTLTDSATSTTPVTFTRASSGTYVDSQGVIRTATTNLLLRSEEFDNAVWGPVRGTVSANQETAPSGAVTADKLIAANGGADGQVATPATITSGATVTGSVYVKAGGFDRLELVLLSNNNTTPYGRSTINPNTGAITTAASASNSATNASSSVQALGNGWYRFSVTVTYPAVTAAGMRLTVFNSDASNGDGVKGIYLWGAQLEQSSTVGEYIPTTSTINSAPRFDHNPTTGESLGLLVEEQRTNSIRNNTMVGAVAGTPGTLPTNWIGPGSSGLTREVIGVGTESGIAYVDVRYFGTTTSALYQNISFEVSNQIAAAQSSIWTSSAFVKLVGGSLANITSAKLVIDNYNSSNVSLGQYAINNFVPTTAALVTQRYSASSTSSTFSNAATAFVRPYLQFEANSGAAIDITLRIGLPQLEQGAFPTSVIPTTTAAVTRSADVASISGSNFGTFRTNLLLRSEEFDNASWPKILATVSANVISAPDGNATADKLEETTGTGEHVAYQSRTGSNETVVLSVFCKQAERTRVRIGFSNFATEGKGAIFDLASGSVVSTEASGTDYTNLSASIVAFPNGWYRCIFRATKGAVNTTNNPFVETVTGTSFSFAGTAGSGIYIWGAQLETGSTATAYIPTTTAAVTVFESSWYRQDEGTVFAESSRPSPAANSFVLAVSDNGFNEFMGLYTDNIPNRIVNIRDNGSVSAVFSLTAGSGISNLIYKEGFVYKLNDFAAVQNGLLAGTDQSGTLPTPNRINIGNFDSGSQFLNGTIRRLTYFPTRLPNSTLQQITQ